MKIVCAWCEKELGEKEPLEDKDITHGMCFRCFLKIRREMRKSVNRKSQVVNRRGNDQKGNGKGYHRAGRERRDTGDQAY